MMSKRENVFRKNNGNDFFFILLLSIAFGILLSTLAINVIKEAVMIDLFTLASLEFGIYFFSTALFFMYYSIKKFEEIE